MSDADALRALIAESGLSARRFAREVLAARGERSVRRWLEEGPPPELAAWLAGVERIEADGDTLTVVRRMRPLGTPGPKPRAD